MRQILVLLLAMASCSAYAQTPDSEMPKLRKLIGVRLGYSQFRLSGSDADLRLQRSGTKNEVLRGATVGIAGRRCLYSALYVQGEFNYVRKGGHFKNSGFYSDQDPIVINYIESPVVFRLMAPAVSKNKFIHLEGGAALNCALNKRKINPNHFYSNTIFEEPAFIISPIVGAGLDYQHGQRMFFLDARYTWDTQDFFSRTFSNDQYTYEYNLRHQGFTVTAGMMLGN